MKYSIAVITSMNNKHYWELIGTNNKRIARSNNYSTKRAADRTARTLLADLNKNFDDIRYVNLNEGEE